MYLVIPVLWASASLAQLLIGCLVIAVFAFVSRSFVITIVMALILLAVVIYYLAIWIYTKWEKACDQYYKFE